MVSYLTLDGDPHLVAQECKQCGALFFDRRNACAHCSSQSFGTRDLATTGVVRSFSIIHQAAPGVPVPYVSSVVGRRSRRRRFGEDQDPQLRARP
jgi:uncharacterized OB-fold protein